MPQQIDATPPARDVRSLITEARLTLKELRTELPAIVQKELRIEMVLSGPEYASLPLVDFAAQARVLSALCDGRLVASKTGLRETDFWGPLCRGIFATCRDSEIAGIGVNIHFLRAALADLGVSGSRVDSALRRVQMAPYHLPRTLLDDHIPRLIDLAKRRDTIELLQRSEALLRSEQSRSDVVPLLREAIEAAR